MGPANGFPIGGEGCFFLLVIRRRSGKGSGGTHQQELTTRERVSSGRYFGLVDKDWSGWMSSPAEGVEFIRESAMGNEEH